MSRLMSDLQRTEQEKKEALEQVNKLKSLLEQGKQHGEKSTKKDKQSLQQLSLATNSNGGLLDQFKGMVSTQGESAAIAWISKQLEAQGGINKNDYSPLSPGYSQLSPSSGRGRMTKGEDLLSSVIPPLTPRSRPGSRAASPERGGGGGLLLSQSLGQAMDKAVSARGKRMTTPLPKQKGGHNYSNEREGMDGGSTRESVEHDYLMAAAKSIPNEYGTQLASYLVRRPYVDLEERDNTTIVTAGNNNNVWGMYSHLTSKEEYLQYATAFKPNSLEILVYVEADGSVFTLTGKSNARHGKLPNSMGMINNETIATTETEEELLDWAVFDDVEEMDRALGRVTYIDVEGNEREYWLDSIYEEALTTRESYCMSMISAAFALKEVTGQRPNVIPMQMSMQSASPMVQPMESSSALPATVMPPPGSITFNQMQAGNKNLTPPMLRDSNAVQPVSTMPSTQDQPHSEPKSNLAPPKEKQAQPPSTSDQKQSTITKPPPEEEYESADSALPHMVMSLFSLLLSMVWFVAKIPFKIGSVLFTFWVLVVVLRILWLFLADDNGAWEMGAGVDYEYNMPGIY